MDSHLKITVESITFTLAAMGEHKDIPKGHKLVSIDTRLVNNSWKNTRDYIGCFHSIKYASAKEKLLNSRKDITEFKVSVPPYIYLDSNGNIDFYNGRNRFANLRNSGVKEMTFVMDSKEYKRFTKTQAHVV
jgi:hypothetical protein